MSKTGEFAAGWLAFKAKRGFSWRWSDDKQAGWKKAKAAQAETEQRIVNAYMARHGEKISPQSAS